MIEVLILYNYTEYKNWVVHSMVMLEECLCGNGSYPHIYCYKINLSSSTVIKEPF